MKVNFNRAALVEALQLLTNVVPARTPKPVLRCVRIEAGKKQVTISATDLEVGIRYTLSNVEVVEPGEVVIPADRLAPIVRESIDDVISLESTDESCVITGSDSHFTVFGLDPSQYPAVPEFEGDADVEIKLTDMQVGIEQCVFACAKESTRYALNGVLWEMGGKKITLVATDGRRLVRTRLAPASVADAKKTTKVIVPAKTMHLLDRVGADEKELVCVQFGESKIVIKCGSVVISSNLVEGNFPKYEDIIPTDYTNKVTLNTDAMLSAVKRSALLTTEESRGIRVGIGKDAIVFSCRAPEAGDAEIKMPVQYSGVPMEIGFNPQFVVDVLRVIRSDELDLELGDSDRPGLIKSGKDFLYVIMPINLG